MFRFENIKFGQHLVKSFKPHFSGQSYTHDKDSAIKIQSPPKNNN